MNKRNFNEQREQAIQAIDDKKRKVAQRLERETQESNGEVQVTMHSVIRQLVGGGVTLHSASNDEQQTVRGILNSTSRAALSVQPADAADVLVLDVDALRAVEIGAHVDLEQLMRAAEVAARAREKNRAERVRLGIYYREKREREAAEQAGRVARGSVDSTDA